MQLIIGDYGTTVRKEGNRFILTSRDKSKIEEYSADSVSQIIIAAGSSISSRVVKLAMESGIDILYVNKFGTPYARIYPCTLGGTTLTRKKQAESYSTKKSVILVKGFVEGKIKNQASLLKSLAKSRSSDDFERAANMILDFSNRLKDIRSDSIDSVRESILGIEGYCAAKYFEALSLALPFKGRDRESKDPVNIAMNYAYGILYGEVEKACIIAGLDPYLGYFHTDRYGKPCMVLDLIEEFRAPVADRAVITLFALKMIDEKDFTENGETKFLNDRGKKKVIEAVMQKFSSEMLFKGRKISLRGIILEQAREVVRLLLDENETYEPYVYRW